ncbi:uncharacterized protein BX664DRAFT_276310 [Halteromyces radiatus]|uniref:uncharacterized protein n=1 Tax=Halteromyces radiatus TaxID=101107 RepID=UPI002220450B|nr:uncharacterized protein BX664DRAFT_276310 [Halteromyces radiatus]KAI8097525.1 hypothetical protein BX664DRAFT_276310 [Halteromyces radiatus]
MRKLTNTIERSAEYVNFINDLSQFHAAKGTTLQVEPILGKKRLDLLKLYKIVLGFGGFEKVTQGRAWKQVGNQFKFPATCTNSAYILKGLYIRNLLGWEEENVNGKTWKPPEELKGPHAHRISTLAGSKYRKHVPRTPSKTKQKKMRTDNGITVFDSTQDTTTYPPTPLSQDSVTYNDDFGDNFSSDSSVVTTNDVILEEGKKQKILFALRFGDDKDIDWALNFLLDLTYTTPQSLPVSNTPMLVELLLEQGQLFLRQKQPIDSTKNSNSDNNNNNSNDTLSSLMDLDEDDESTVKMDRLKKVLHIIRNYSTCKADSAMLSTHAILKELVIKTLDMSTLTGGLEIGRYCIDIVENMASDIPLAGPDDPWIPCLTKLIYAQDRYLVVASIRALTVIGMCDLNQLFLANNTQVMGCIAQNLLATDEELVGVSLEYLYQQVNISAECRSQMLSAYEGAYVGLLVNKLQFSVKYYVSKLIKDDVTTATTPSSMTLQPLSPSGSSSSNSSISSVNTHNTAASNMIGGTIGLGNQHTPIPSLVEYSTLEEPFRCLGWLKDKFEATHHTHSLSLDDLYLLYYSRFGMEKALKIHHFYSVLTIAFPEQPPSYVMENGQIIRNPSTFGTKIEGLCVKGLQIKMNILHDELSTHYLCQWAGCTDNIYSDSSSLENHIQNHIQASDDYVCEWNNCSQSIKSKDELITHLLGHIAEIPQTTMVESTPFSSYPSTLSPSTSSQLDDNNGINDQNDKNNEQGTMNTNNLSVLETPCNELKGVPLVAIHILRLLSEDPSSPAYLTPYEIKLISISDSKPSLSPYVYSILSNIRLHSTGSSPTL